MSLEQDGYIQSKRRQGAFVLDVSGKPGVSIPTTAEIVTQAVSYTHLDVYKRQALQHAGANVAPR